jgi:hypothetical protein
MKLKADFIQGITKRSNVRDMEKYLFKVSYKLGNRVKKNQRFKFIKENT